MKKQEKKLTEKEKADLEERLYGESGLKIDAVKSLELKDKSEEGIEEAYTLLKEQLEDVMNTLTPREAKVLKLRFGLEDGKARTLEEVGREFMVTRERIRQIK